MHSKFFFYNPPTDPNFQVSYGKQSLSQGPTIDIFIYFFYQLPTLQQVVSLKLFNFLTMRFSKQTF